MINYPRSWRISPAASAGMVPEPPKGRPWWSITDQGTGPAEILIYDEIGYWGYTAQEFVKDLRALGGRDLTVRISSPGGEVFDALAIHHALKTHPGHVHVTIDGLAASAASFIAMAGDRVEVAKHARFMIHEAAGVCIGNAHDMAEMADLLDRLSGTIADIYAERAGGTAARWRERMRAETWYTAAEAVAAGLADEVADYEASARNSGDPLAELRERHRERMTSTVPASKVRRQLRDANRQWKADVARLLSGVTPAGPLTIGGGGPLTLGDGR